MAYRFSSYGLHTHPIMKWWDIEFRLKAYTSYNEILSRQSVRNWHHFENQYPPHNSWTRPVPRRHSGHSICQRPQAWKWLACWNGIRSAPTLTYGATRQASNWFAAPMSTPAKRCNLSRMFSCPAVGTFTKRVSGNSKQWLRLYVTTLSNKSAVHWYEKRIHIYLNNK